MITGIQYYTAQGKRPSFQGLFYFFTAGCRRHDSLLHSITPIFTRPQAKNEHVFDYQQSVGNSCRKATRDDLYHSTGIGLDTLETTQTLHHGRGHGKAPANPRSPSPRRVTPRLRPVVCDTCAPPRPRPLSFFLLPCLRGRGFPPLVPSSAFVGPAGFGSAVSGRPPVSSALLRYARAVKGNPPTRGPPCVHGGRGGLSLSFLILTAVCLDEQTLAYSLGASSLYSGAATSPTVGGDGWSFWAFVCPGFFLGITAVGPDSTPFGADRGRGSLAIVSTGVRALPT